MSEENHYTLESDSAIETENPLVDSKSVFNRVFLSTFQLTFCIERIIGHEFPHP